MCVSSPKEEAEAAQQAEKEEAEAAVQRRLVAKEEAEAVQAEAEAAVQTRLVVHKAARQAAANQEAKKEESHSRFVGYDELEIEAQVVLTGEGEDDLVRLVLDRTPFYAEAGGQVGDRGRIKGNGFVVEVEDVQKVDGRTVHIGRLTEGDAEALEEAIVTFDTIVARVDRQARMDAERNHTATHLLHESLRLILGDHVGSDGFAGRAGSLAL